MATVLVVDDDEDLADVVVEVLRAQGHEVRCAPDGAEGLRLVAQQLPDLLVLDVEMPVLSGPDMANRLLIEDMGRENIPIVLLSGVADLSRATAMVGTPYALRKPTTLPTLLGMVRRALAERIAPSPQLPVDGGD